MSSSEVASRWTAVAAGLARFDVGPGDHVLILLPDGPGFEEVFSGVTKLGAVALPVNPQLTAAEIVVLAAETGARLAIGWAEQVQGITTDPEAQPLTQVDWARELWVATLRPH